METPTYQLIWTGAALDPSGYGEASREYLKALHANHPDLCIRFRPKYFFAGERRAPSMNVVKMLTQMSEQSHKEGPLVSIQHLTPENYTINPTASWHVGMTTFETDAIPYAWQQNLRAMDEIIVFSKFNKDVFESMGIKRPITVVPHGVDTNLFNPANAVPLPAFGDALPSDTYIFGSNFDWTARKNPEALVAAYVQEFKKDDPVCLFLKIYHQGDMARSTAIVLAKIQDIVRRMGQTPGEQAKIRIIGAMMSPEEMPGFYAGLDCYVLPSRGEGWSLTHSEAMAMGLVTIGVNWGGNTEFMNDENSLLLKNFKLREIVAADEVPPHYLGHRWADCNIDELRSAMRHAFTMGDGLSSKMGRQARCDMMEKFSWDIASDRLAALVRQRCEERAVPQYRSTSTAL